GVAVGVGVRGRGPMKAPSPIFGSGVGVGGAFVGTRVGVGGAKPKGFLMTGEKSGSFLSRAASVGTASGESVDDEDGRDPARRPAVCALSRAEAFDSPRGQYATAATTTRSERRAMRRRRSGAVIARAPSFAAHARRPARFRRAGGAGRHRGRRARP